MSHKVTVALIELSQPPPHEKALAIINRLAPDGFPTVESRVVGAPWEAARRLLAGRARTFDDLRRALAICVA